METRHPYLEKVSGPAGETKKQELKNPSDTYVQMTKTYEDTR